MSLTAPQITALRRQGEALLPEIIRWRRTIHAAPELRMDTPVTEAFIVRELRAMGIEEIRSGVGGHGVTAVIRGAYPGKCLAIRADCDALPIREETGLPFAASNGCMHACGHDAHTAMALGAAKLLHENRGLLRGTVKLIFQPYEEGDRGASLMIADGVLDDPKVDAIIALHNNCTPDDDYQPGDVLVLNGATSANIYAYEAVFRGDGAHVCLSRKARSAVYMACDAVAQIARLPEPGPETVNAVTVVQGGVRNNVVPETCTVLGSIRAFDRGLHQTMIGQVRQILSASAEAYGGSLELRSTIDLMGTEINSALYDRFVRAADAVYPERPCRTLKEREMIGEDFARYADVIPGMYFMLHTRPAGSSYPLHHPKFDVNEAVLPKGSILFAAFALLWQEP